jgi:hypothetical protein
MLFECALCPAITMLTLVALVGVRGRDGSIREELAARMNDEYLALFGLVLALTLISLVLFFLLAAL